MANPLHGDPPDPRNRWYLGGLVALACASWVAYLVIALSAQSLYEEGSGKHSLLGLLALFAVTFVCYLTALGLAVRTRQDRWLVGLIVVAGVAFRGTLLFSNPIAEIDLYRYVWDGAVSTQGVSPFRYSPQQVLAVSAEETLPDDLARLVALRDGSPVLAAILKRIHFGELPTVYPPVSQVVFALASFTTPHDASVLARLTWMKVWFVGFDVATLWLVMQLQRLVRRPVGWSLAYAWCPLLIKEIANTGHLDSLAFFLVTLSVYCAVRAIFDTPAKEAKHSMAYAAAIVLALGVGAKLYPVILAPLLCISLASRWGWRSALGPTLGFTVVTAIVLWPMVPNQNYLTTADQTAFDAAQVAIPVPGEPPVPPQPVSTTPRDPSQSVRAFLTDWEMNDFLFLILIENLKSTADLPPGEVAWFSIVPESWRIECLALAERHLSSDLQRLPFLLTRAVTSVIFGFLALFWAWHARRAASASDWLGAAFLTVAWFWLLLPTLNPWYWTWALPLLPFARGRAWLALSGLVFLYYFRFWLAYHYSEATVFGTPYRGPIFFDYVVTWLEFGPWFVWLGVDRLRSRQ